MMARKWFLVSISLLILSGCAVEPMEEPDQGVVRKKTMDEAALSYGAQSALAYYGSRYNEVVEKIAPQLDQIYNFNRFILANNVLPPVVRQARKEMASDGYESLRLTDRTIQIIRPAKFVTVPPSWRDYILVAIQRPDLPDERMWPRTDDEYELWAATVNRGWQQGKQQMMALAKQKLSLLKQDYTGIILYHELLAQNMVSEPMVGKDSLGVTGDKNSLRLNDQVLRITARSDLNTKPTSWRPVVVKGVKQPQRLAAVKTTGK